jgi:hypothetical protein
MTETLLEDLRADLADAEDAHHHDRARQLRSEIAEREGHPVIPDDLPELRGRRG